ncbi:MAG: DUF4153 domain-containing protein, partial [Methylophagaceae bacterium]
YFLAHIPKQFDYQRSECQFPHGVVFILTYVLVPLALVYMVVLYAYFIKIMVQWTLPHGHLGTMISIFGVIGIITHLAIYPIHDRSNSILSWFYRHFYLIMIVPLALLAIAIGERIAQYGVTDFRYIVVACAIWFAILIISYLKNKQQFRLKHVTLSLALLSLLASFGPWGIHQLPINSQFSRLESVLIKNDLLINGKLNVVQQPDFEIQKSISSMVDYLVSHSAGHTLRPWIADKKAFDNELPYNSDRAHRRYNGQRIVDLMGIDYVDRWQYKDNHYSEISLKTVQNHLTRRAFSVSDYDLFIPLNWINSHDALSINATENNKHTGLTLALTAQGMLIVSNTQGQQLQFDLLAVAEQFSNNRSYQVEPDNADKLILEQSSNNIAGKLYIDRLQFQQKNGNRNIHILVGNLLLKIPE